MSSFATILAETILFCVPLLLVALGGMFSERSGIINLALEGIMIVGALFGCLFLNAVNKAGNVSSPQLMMFLAILIAAVVGGIFSLLLAFAAINLKADQTITGTALNMLAPAIAIIISWAIQGQGQTTINLPTWIKINVATNNTDGFFYIVFGRSLYLTTIIAVIIFGLSAFILYKTKFGLRLRSCGENPQAAASVGINVFKMRYIGTFISGCLAGIGGLAFTIAAGSGFQSSVAGYGFLALAVMIFGNWNPITILGSSAFFALFKTLSSMYDSIKFLPKFNFAEYKYIYLMVPYIFTMVVLALTSKKSRAPKAEGIPYDKGMR